MATVRRQVLRSGGGRAALKLLRDHGGPDLLEQPQPASDPEFAEDPEAQVARLEDELAEARLAVKAGG